MRNVDLSDVGQRGGPPKGWRVSGPVEGGFRFIWKIREDVIGINTLLLYRSLRKQKLSQLKKDQNQVKAELYIVDIIRKEYIEQKRLFDCGLLYARMLRN